MSKSTQLAFVSLQVNDLEASRRFYTDVLAFKPADQSPPNALVFADQTGASFAIRTPLVDLTATSRLGWGVALWFSVADLDAFRQQIENRVELVQDIQQTPFGRTLVLADPDGYRLTFQQTPDA